jgi:hypothetical protein
VQLGNTFRFPHLFFLNTGMRAVILRPLFLIELFADIFTMAAVNPHTFFRFASEHDALLTELYYKSNGLPEVELLSIIRRHNNSMQSPGAGYIRDRLVELGFLDRSPHASAEFEMVRPVAALVGYLPQEWNLFPLP